MKIIAIYGKSNSGKDTLMKELVSAGVGVPWLQKTTRQKRPHETEGVEYRFVDKLPIDISFKQEFKIYDGSVVEYGYDLADIYSSSHSVFIGVFHPSQLDELINLGLDVKHIYLRTSRHVRRKRAYLRGDGVDTREIERRLKSDDLDFKGFSRRLICLDPTRNTIKIKHTIL